MPDEYLSGDLWDFCPEIHPDIDPDIEIDDHLEPDDWFEIDD
jgi:hypothetical protein